MEAGSFFAMSVFAAERVFLPEAMVAQGVETVRRMIDLNDAWLFASADQFALVTD
jgi:hypothetical protein